MRSLTFAAFAAGLGCVLAAHGCNDDGRKQPEKGPQVCQPHTVYSCFRAGCRGFQACSADGSALTPCTCYSDDPEDSGVPVDAGEPTDASEPADAMPPADAGPDQPEQCDNGEDDDDDGDTDCADSDCGERSCELPAADSYRGPIALRRSDSATPSCDGAWETPVFEAGESPSAAAASCTACSCTPSAGSCSMFVDFGTGSEAGCGGTTCTTSVNQSCVEIMPPCIAGMGMVYLGTKLPSGAASCTPSTPTATKPEVSWARRVIGCSTEPAMRGGCDSGEVCLPKPTASAGGDVKLCVYRDGEHDCPSDRYTEKHTYYRELNDTRACSACTCSGANCSYSWSVFNAADTSCATPIVKLTSAGQCVQVNPSADRLRVGATIQGDGSCTAAGGESQGSVSGSDPITVCCKP